MRFYYKYLDTPIKQLSFNIGCIKVRTFILYYFFKDYLFWLYQVFNKLLQINLALQLIDFNLESHLTSRLT